MTHSDENPAKGAQQADNQHENLDTLDDLWGAMKGTVIIAPGVDLTEPTGEVWDAETGEGKFRVLFEKP